MSTNPNWDEHLRIGDKEREQAAAALGEHYAQGRLTTEEHSERLDRIWAAKTRSELAPVFTDLPGPGSPRPAPPPQAPRFAPGPAVRRRRRFPLPLVVLFGILLTVTVLTNLPLILIGLGVWFLLARCWGGSSRSRHYQTGYRQARY
jgi:hypothetical protein